MGDLIPLRRRARLPAAWRPYLRRRGVPAAQLRMMVWIGLLLGLLFYQALRLWTSPQSVTAPLPATAPTLPPDPYAEAERSREILKAQEGAPSPAIPSGGPLEAVGRSDPVRVVASSPASSGGPVQVIDGDTMMYTQTFRHTGHFTGFAPPRIPPKKPDGKKR